MGAPVRTRSLDVMRGFAALVVVLHHYVLAWPSAYAAYFGAAPSRWRLLFDSPAFVLVNGRGAVMLFFVLSGAVLTLALEDGRRVDYFAYAARRFARIWAPFAVAILLAAACERLLRPGPVAALSPWFNNSWNIPATPAVVARHLLMLGTIGELDNPMWSLVHEMRISLVFPLLLAALRRWPGATLAACCALAILAGAALGSGAPLPVPVSQILQSGFYLAAFAIGALLALNRARILAAAPRLGAPGVTLLVGAGLVLLGFARYREGAIEGVEAAGAELAAASGAALLVAVGLAEPPQARPVAGKEGAWLGRVSYSLYLLHVPVLLAGARLLGGLPYPVAALVALVASLALAHAFNALVERPSRALGRRLAGPQARAAAQSGARGITD